MAIKSYKIYYKKRFWAGILLAQFLLFFLLSKVQWAINCNEHFYEIQKDIHQKIFAWTKISIGDLFYISLGIFLIITIYKSLKSKRKNKFRITLLISVNLLYFVYQIFWGLLYFQEPLIKKLPQQDPTLIEAKQLAIKYLNSTKELREKVTEDSDGVFVIKNINEIETTILNQQTELPKWLTKKESTQINSIKPSLFKDIMSQTGILGYYNPFTAEAQYNPQLPSTYIPFTIAHETSHQLGFAREQEANFIAYLIGKNSNDNNIRYSTHYFVLKSLLQWIVEQDPIFVKSILSNYSEGMKRDRKKEIEFKNENESWLNSFFSMTNNLFLKSNQQDGSITYSYFVDLLLKYERLETP